MSAPTRSPANATRRRRLLPHAFLAAAGLGLAWAIVAFAIFPGSGAAGTVTVPPLVGLSYDAAAQRLAEVGLKATVGETRQSGSAPGSTVMAQTPPSGARLVTGTTVVLELSGGPARTTLPSVIGLTIEDATATLQSTGFTVGEVVEQAGPDPRGTVVATRPDAGQAAPVGTSVQLTVSAGPAELSMPDVAGRSQAEARALLEQLGLVPALEYDSTSTGPTGLVLVQTPPPGTPLPVGATVTLRVAGRP